MEQGTDREWFSKYAERSAELVQRTARTASRTAARWGDRSLSEDEWTADSVTADLIEAWEELTPLVGEGLELWLELVQRTLSTGRARG